MSRRYPIVETDNLVFNIHVSGADSCRVPINSEVTADDNISSEGLICAEERNIRTVG